MLALLINSVEFLNSCGDHENEQQIVLLSLLLVFCISTLTEY